MVASAQPVMDYEQLRTALGAASAAKRLYQAIVDAPLEQELASAYLFLGFMSLFLGEADTQEVRLVAASNNEYYNLAIQSYTFDANDYRLSLETDKNNDIVKAILEDKPQDSTDWKAYTRRKKDPDQARLNQKPTAALPSAVSIRSKCQVVAR